MTDLQGPIGFFSDVHGNTLALSAALKILDSKNCQQKIFLGDAVGYIPTTDALDQILGTNDIVCIRGNHEQMLLDSILTGYSDLDAIYQLIEVRSKLTSSHFEQLEQWPESLTFTFSGKKILCVHGSPANPIFGYIYPDSSMPEVDFDYVFIGNTHRPFIRKIGRTTFVNVGSVGLPRDHGSWGSLVVLDPSIEDLRIIRFDISGSSRKISELGLSVHHSVLDIFDRSIPRHEMTGEILDD